MCRWRRSDPSSPASERSRVANSSGTKSQVDINLCLSIHIFTHTSIYLSILSLLSNLYIHILPIYLHIIFIYLPINLSIYLTDFQSNYLCYPSIYISIYISTYLSIYHASIIRPEPGLRVRELPPPGGRGQGHSDSQRAQATEQNYQGWVGSKLSLKLSSQKFIYVSIYIYLSKNNRIGVWQQITLKTI